MPSKVRSLRKASIYMREWCKNHPEWREYNAGRHNGIYFRYKELVYERLGNVCKICGFSDRRALQIDHIFGAKNKIYKDLGLDSNKGYGYPYLKKIAELDNLTELFQLLCANHNWIKKAEQNENAYPERLPRRPDEKPA